MTRDLIDRAEALAVVMEECWKAREMKLAERIEGRIAALPAVTVDLTPAPVTPGQRIISAAREALDVARGHADPAGVYVPPDAATRIAAVPPSETLIDRLSDEDFAGEGDVPCIVGKAKPAPDAAIREAALREAADALERECRGYSAAVVLALITEKPHAR